LGSGRRIELEKVLGLPCPHVSVWQDSLAFTSAIRIAESMKANTVRPLDNTLNTLLDEDRRQLLERAGPRRRLPVRTDASEVDIRKAVSGHV
jgi:hypothetical protein